MAETNSSQDALCARARRPITLAGPVVELLVEKCACQRERGQRATAIEVWPKLVRAPDSRHYKDRHTSPGFCIFLTGSKTLIPPSLVIPLLTLTSYQLAVGFTT
jgi:hypothetical protein